MTSIYNMAQALFDALTGVSTIDNQTVLAVQSLLESQGVSAETAPVPEDEDDMFQCGKCKKSFNSLTLFMSHKKTCTGTIINHSTSVTCASQASIVTTSSSQQVAISSQSALQFPNSPMSQINHSLVLTENDLLSLNLDASTLPPAHFLTHHPVSPSSSHTNVSILTNTMTPTPSASSQSILVGNINTAPVNVISPTSISVDPTGTLMVNSTNLEKLLIKQPVQTFQSAIGEQQPRHKLGKDDDDDEDEECIKDETVRNHEATVLDKDSDSTVNIITEFHSSMVKQRRHSDVDKSSHSLSEITTNVSVKGKLKCAYCNKSFGKNFDLQQHIRSHTGEKPFQCIVCGRAFAQKSNVKKHMQTHKVWPDGLSSTLPKYPLETRLAEDDSCNFEINSEGKKSTKTNVAGISVNATYDDSGNVHIIVDNSYVCPYCPFSGKTYTDLKSHMKNHKIEKVYKCIMKDCGETFTDLDPFLEHIKIHENEMEYCCHMCHKSFSSLYDLGVHQYTHSLYPSQGPRPGPRYYRCVKCLNKYASPSGLEHHMATTSHNYPCSHCNKVFTCERYLRRHLLVHGTMMIHKCNVCSKGFKTDHYLKMHMLIHTGEKPFKCKLCGNAFNRKDKLKRHDLIHETVKKFKCPFKNHTGCMKDFNRPDKLKAHILTHSGIKPFKCKFCQKYFSRRSHVRDHERFHQGDFPFECFKCNKKFLREKRLKEHKCNSFIKSEDRTDSKFSNRFDTDVKKRRGRPRKNHFDAYHIEDVGPKCDDESKSRDDNQSDMGDSLMVTRGRRGRQRDSVLDDPSEDDIVHDTSHTLEVTELEPNSEFIDGSCNEVEQHVIIQQDAQNVASPGKTFQLHYGSEGNQKITVIHGEGSDAEVIEINYDKEKNDDQDDVSLSNSSVQLHFEQIYDIGHEHLLQHQSNESKFNFLQKCDANISQIDGDIVSQKNEKYVHDAADKVIFRTDHMSRIFCNGVIIEGERIKQTDSDVNVSGGGSGEHAILHHSETIDLRPTR